VRSRGREIDWRRAKSQGIAASLHAILTVGAMAGYVKVFGRRPSRTFPHARRPASENLQGTKPRGRARSGAVPRAQLWGFESQARSQREAILNGRWPRMRAQLKRYGMDIAKWGFEVSGHMRFQRVRRGKNITCHNFRVVRFATMDRPKQCH
jgi:hypothetical protein